jgi:hypothetical protein
MAERQERAGYPERAATARALAEWDRELHPVAVAEMAEYLARIKAVEDSRASRRRDG